MLAAAGAAGERAKMTNLNYRGLIAQFRSHIGVFVVARIFLRCAVVAALLLPLGACIQGMPDPVGWLSTYPRMCVPGFHAVPSPKGDGYNCVPNSN
jgi:hypothetical protein